MRSFNFDFSTELYIPVRVEVENYHPGTPATREYPGDPAEWDDYRVMIGKLDVTDYLPQSVLNDIINTIPEEASEAEWGMMVDAAEAGRDR